MKKNVWKGIGVVIALIACLAYPNFAQNAGNLVRFSVQNTELRLVGSLAEVRIQVFSNNIFKVTQFPSNGVFPDTSYAVVGQPLSIRQFQLLETPTMLTIVTPSSQLEITKSPISVALKSNGKTKIKQDVFGYKNQGVTLSFVINPSEIFHGTGGRVSKISLTGKVAEFTNTFRSLYFDDIYGQTYGLAQSITIPFFVASGQYGLLLDSSLPGDMRTYLGALDSTRIDAQITSAGLWSYFFINGTSNDEILYEYTALTGRQPLVPRWALGYLQSKNSYNTERELNDVVSNFQSQNFPLDAIILNTPWQGNSNNLGNFSWSRTGFSSPSSMIKNWLGKGVKTVVMNSAYVNKASTNYRSLDSLRLLTKTLSGTTGILTQTGDTTSLLDVFRPNFPQWLAKQLNPRTEEGVSGWASIGIEPPQHPSFFIHTNTPSTQVHNLYSLLWAKTIYDNHRKNYPSVRLFHLTSSAWTGAQRYGILPWTGNVARYWVGLSIQIPILIHAGYSGLGYMHSDIGGYVTPSDKTPKDEEMDMRWTQFGVFSPIMRVNGERNITEPYILTQPFYTNTRAAIRLRYQLLPYIYSLAYQNTTTGRPLCLSMDYFEPSNRLASIDDQFFFGKSLLVAPIMLHGMLVRKIQLPNGKWFDFWSKKSYQGGGAIFENVTFEKIPVFVPAGAFVPMAVSAKSSTDAYLSDSLVVKFYQDVSVPNSEFTIFHDKGTDANVLENDSYELLRLAGKSKTDTISVTLTRMRTYAQGLGNRYILLEVKNVTNIPKAVLLDGQTIPISLVADAPLKVKTAYYDLANLQLSLPFDWDCSKSTTVQVLRTDLNLLTNTIPQEQEALIVYPNPVHESGVVTLQIHPPTTDAYTVEVLDILGGVVYKQALGSLSQHQTTHHSFSAPSQKGVFTVLLKNTQGEATTQKIMIL